MDSLPLKKIPKIYHESIIRFNEKIKSLFAIDNVVLRMPGVTFRINTDNKVNSITINEMRKILCIVYFNIIKEYNSFLVVSKSNILDIIININKSTSDDSDKCAYIQYNVKITTNIMINDIVMNKIESSTYVQIATENYNYLTFDFRPFAPVYNDNDLEYSTLDYDVNHGVIFESILTQLLKTYSVDELYDEIYNNIDINPINYNISLDEYIDPMLEDFKFYLKMLNSFNFNTNDIKNKSDIEASFEWVSDTFNITILSDVASNSTINNTIIFIDKIFKKLIINDIISYDNNNYMKLKSVRDYLSNNYKELFYQCEEGKLFINIKNKPDAEFFQPSKVLADLLESNFPAIKESIEEASKNDESNLRNLAQLLKTSLERENEEINGLVTAKESLVKEIPSIDDLYTKYLNIVEKQTEAINDLTEEELAYINHPFINTDGIPVPPENNELRTTVSDVKQELNSFLDILKNNNELLKNNNESSIIELTTDEALDKLKSITTNLDTIAENIAEKKYIAEKKLENDNNELNKTLLEMLKTDNNELNKTLLEMLKTVKNDGNIVESKDVYKRGYSKAYFDKNDEIDISINTIEETIEENPKCISEHKIYSRQAINSDEYVSKNLISNLIIELSNVNNNINYITEQLKKL